MAANRISLSLTPEIERLLDEMTTGRLGPFKRASIATFALGYGLRALAAVPSGIAMASLPASP